MTAKQEAVVLCGDIDGTNARLSAWKTGAKSQEIFSKVLGHRVQLHRPHGNIDGPMHAWPDKPGMDL